MATPIVNDSQHELTSRTLLLVAIGIIVVGLLLLFISYLLNAPAPPNNYPLAAHVTSNLGTLFVFGAGYTLISEMLLKKDFARQLNRTIDDKLRSIELNRSVVEFGLSEVD